MKERVIERLNLLAEQIRSNMASKRVNASGRTSRSLRVVEYEGGVKLVSAKDETHTIETPRGTITMTAAPMATTEVGRPAGRVPRGFYYILKEWSREKGLHFDSERERGTFAYFLSRKIAERGTQRNATNIDVYSQSVEQAKKDIASMIGAEIREMIKTNYK